MSNPFSPTPSRPGHGTIHLSLLPPRTPRLRTVNYQYPLKLVAPPPLRTPADQSDVIHTVYLLSYGGGIVAGDSIDLNVTLEHSTRLILLTQGSTKLFKSPSRDVLSEQSLTAELAPGCGLCYLPDPVQPFARSCFEQRQVYNVLVPREAGLPGASLCVLDWVSNGRPANGENWSFHRYASRNEIYLNSSDGDRKLLLRDSLVLDEKDVRHGIARRMDGLAVFGTLILYGPLFKALSEFFMNEFRLLPRIGGRKWDASSDSGEEDDDPTNVRRAERHRREATEGILWSAALVRGCVVVKIGASELEHARKWLCDMLTEEGSVSALFGDRALLCLRW